MATVFNRHCCYNAALAPSRADQRGGGQCIDAWWRHRAAMWQGHRWQGIECDKLERGHGHDRFIPSNEGAFDAEHGCHVVGINGVHPRHAAMLQQKLATRSTQLVTQSFDPHDAIVWNHTLVAHMD